MMATNNPNDAFLEFAEEGNAKLPSGLNTLTILTFVGSGIMLLFTIIMPWYMNFSLKMIDMAMSSGKEITAKDLQRMEDAKKLITLTQANMVPLMITGVIGGVLCIVGAMMMRKYKKDGYWIYLGGEFLPLIASFVIMGTAQYNSAFSIIIGVGIPLLFALLYANQLKHLK